MRERAKLDHPLTPLNRGRPEGNTIPIGIMVLIAIELVGIENPSQKTIPIELVAKFAMRISVRCANTPPISSFDQISSGPYGCTSTH